MQSSSDPRGLFRCYNRVVVIKPSPKPWGCWHAAGVTSASPSPRSPQLLDSRRAAGDVASTPEVRRGCDDVSFETLPKFPLAVQELLIQWKGVILTPGLLALGREPGCSHSIHISCSGCSFELPTKTNHASKNTGELRDPAKSGMQRSSSVFVFLA